MPATHFVSAALKHLLPMRQLLVATVCITYSNDDMPSAQLDKHQSLTTCWAKARFPLPELTARVAGPSTRLVETRARQHGPC